MLVGKDTQLVGERTSSAGPVFKVINTGAGAALRVEMKKGQSIKAESDALVVKSEFVELDSKLDGGVLSSMFRAQLTNESMFFQTLTARRGDDNDILVAAPETGDIILLDCSKEPMSIIKGGFLAADSTVNLSTASQFNFSKVVFGSGLFILQAEGQGIVAINSHGSMLKYTLKPGEKRSVDNGHVVAWSSHMKYEVGMATTSIYSSITSGEGMMCHFFGPGTVYIQTHKPKDENSQSGDGKPRPKLGPVAGICVFLFVMLILVLALADIATDTGSSNISTRTRYQQRRY